MYVIEVTIVSEFKFDIGGKLSESVECYGIFPIAQYIMQTRANIENFPLLASLLFMHEVLYRSHRAYPTTKDSPKQDCRHDWDA